MGKTFGITNSQDLFRVFRENYADYEKNRASARKAMNCVTIAWHLIDWENQNSKKKLGEHRDEFCNKCPELMIMADICNSYKHFEVDEEYFKRSDIKTTAKHDGTYSEAYSSKYDISRLEIIDMDGNREDFNHIMKIVFDFWTEYFESKPS